MPADVLRWNFSADLPRRASFSALHRQKGREFAARDQKRLATLPHFVKE